MLFSSPGVADMYTFWMNRCNTQPESYQQRVYKNTLATFKHQIRQADNHTPAVVITIEAACVVNLILLDYLTSKVALEEPEIGGTDPNIPIDNNCHHDKLHFEMPGGSGDYKDDSDESDKHDAIHTASRGGLATTELL
jgi:hypothetical protein